jgi:transposase
MLNQINLSTKDSLGDRPDSEVKSKKSRRIMSAGYKLQILEELDSCATSIERAAVMRREGLYSSRISTWRKERASGVLSAFNKQRGRKIKYDPAALKITALEKEVEQLKAQLLQAETVIDIQKKVSEIFGIKTQQNVSNGRKL